MSANIVLGSVAVRQHTVVGFAGPVTGLLISNFSIALYLDGSAAPETISLVELGSGNYEFRFTPLSAGTYTFFGVELTNFANSAQNSFNDAWVVVSSAAVFIPAASNAFCSLSDVQRVTNRTFSSTSNPTDTSVLGFMEEVAAEMSATFRRAGQYLTPAAMASPIDTSTDAGKHIQDLARLANALGAAALAEGASYGGTPPNDSDRPNQFQDRYLSLMGWADKGSGVVLMGTIPAFVKSVFAGGFMSSHRLSSEVAAATAPTIQPQEPGLKMTGDRIF